MKKRKYFCGVRTHLLWAASRSVRLKPHRLSLTSCFDSLGTTQGSCTSCFPSSGKQALGLVTANKPFFVLFGNLHVSLLGKKEPHTWVKRGTECCTQVKGEARWLTHGKRVTFPALTSSHTWIRRRQRVEKQFRVNEKPQGPVLYFFCPRSQFLTCTHWC